MIKTQPGLIKTISLLKEKSASLSVMKDHIADTILSLVLSLVTMFSSVAPFGVSYFGATFSGVAWVAKMASVIVGSCLSLGVAAGIKYIFSLVIFTISMVVISNNRPVCKAIVLSLSVTLVNLIILLASDALIYDVAVALCEGFICFVSVLIMDKAHPLIKKHNTRTHVSVNEVVCVTFVLSLILLSLSDLPEVFSLNIINILSLSLCLCLCYKSDVGMGAAMGVVVGAVNGFSDSNVAMMMGLYAFSAMIGSLFRRVGKIGVCLGFILSSSFLSVFIGGTVDFLVDIYEIIISCVIFLIIPEVMLRYFDFVSDNADSFHSPTVYNRIQNVVSSKITAAAEALKYLSVRFINFNSDAQLYSKKEFVKLFDECASHVCVNCGMKFNCWQSSYKKSYHNMFLMMEVCDNFGELTTSNAPYDFKRSCVKMDEFIEEFNVMYRNYKIEKIWRMKIMESKNVAVTQLDCVAEVVNNISDEINLTVDSEAEKEITSSLDKNGYNVSYVWVLVKDEEQFEINVSLMSYRTDDEKRICDLVSNIVKKPLRVAGINCNDNKAVITLLPREKYSVSVGVCQSSKDGEEYCGDSYASVCLTDGGHFVAICDGMGTGEAAHNESVAIMELLKQLIEAGFTLDAALNLINSSLILRNKAEMFSTLDVCSFDLKNGQAFFKKAGGAESIVYCEGKFDVIRCETLPVGIKMSDGVGVFSRSLKNGGIIVMMSDGVAESDESIDWICRTIEERKNNNPQTIAKLIMDTVIRKNGGRCIDDMTVIVSKLSLNV